MTYNSLHKRRMNLVNSIKIPSRIYSGKGSMESIKDIIKKEQARSVILFADQAILSQNLLDRTIAIMEELQIVYEVISDIKPEPSYEDIETVLNRIQLKRADLLLAVGGGSVLDCAKICSVLINADYNIQDILLDSSLAKKQLKTVLVPSTCGTGSEATINAIVLKPEEDLKVGIVTEEFLCDYVILDSDMIKSLPRSIIAATGIDALCHAVECYTSNKANVFSNFYAIESAKLIIQNIKNTYNNPEDEDAKMNLLIAAFYAGVAINGSGTTAVHALSYPLGGKYHIPHGISNAILLVNVLEFNLPYCYKEMAQLYDAIDPWQQSLKDDEKARKLLDIMKEIVTAVEIPTDLSAYSITKDDIEYLVEAASKVTRLLNNNCIELKKEDIRSIYVKLIKGCDE